MRECKILGSDGGARSASIGDEAPLPTGAWGCSTSKPPFPHVGDRKRIPRLWSAGRLQLPVRPRPFASSFRVSSPPSYPRENPPLPSRTNEKMVAPAGPRYFSCGKGAVLIRRKFRRAAFAGWWVPLCRRSSPLLFEIWSRHKQQPVSHRGA